MVFPSIASLAPHPAYLVGPCFFKVWSYFNKKKFLEIDFCNSFSWSTIKLYMLAGHQGTCPHLSSLSFSPTPETAFSAVPRGLFQESLCISSPFLFSGKVVTPQHSPVLSLSP